METQRKVAITGAAGNLGGVLARAMLGDDIVLHLLTHTTPLADDLASRNNVKVFRVDLEDKDTLHASFEGVDTIVHFAGVLFKGNPEGFLPTTNIAYFKNLLDVAVTAKVRRVILVSFPHVEGATTPENPAKGSLTGAPISVHATTRLEEERLLLNEKNIEGVVLRCGMVYGKGILMMDVAHWFSKYAILGIWKGPTCIHLISTEDFAAATKAAVYNQEAKGIYHLGDDGVQSLQEFLDEATTFWGTTRPWRMPLWLINSAATVFEGVSLLTGCRSPLTRDFVTIGQVSYYGDTSRMKQDLLPKLRYATFRDGISTL